MAGLTHLIDRQAVCPQRQGFEWKAHSGCGRNFDLKDVICMQPRGLGTESPAAKRGAHIPTILRLRSGQAAR